MYDSDTGRSRGFGFVTYKEPACVHIACQGSHVLDGKKVMNTSRAFIISRLDDWTINSSFLINSVHALTAAKYSLHLHFL